MADELHCDFCGTAMEWTPEQKAWDAALRNPPHCTGLGAMCDACGDREIEIERAAEERRQLEDEEMERHYRRHPHG